MNSNPNEERLKTLSQRFTQQKTAESTKETTKVTKDVQRKRHSLYLDNGLVERTDQVYKDVSHELYPKEISKSDFLEACLSYALSHLDDIKAML